MAEARESDLYGPVKAYLEDLGFTVRAEVGKCDVAALREGTLVVVELKLSFGLPVLYQALERLSSCDLVYVAVAVPDGRKARANWDAQLPKAVRLCRMLGVGLMSVRDGRVEIQSEPAPYQPRKQPGKRARMLSEMSRRSGDHNVAGTTKRPRVTAYREDALRCAEALEAAGRPKASREIRGQTGVGRAASIMRANVYGWFEQVDRGVYALTETGAGALRTYRDVLEAQHRRSAAASGVGEPCGSPALSA